MPSSSKLSKIAAQHTFPRVVPARFLFKPVPHSTLSRALPCMVHATRAELKSTASICATTSA